MCPATDDLTSVKDDMIAFIEGHGMRRFHGFVNYEEVQCIAWEDNDDPDGWKKFVELARESGAPFLTMHSWILDRDDLDSLMKRLANAQFSNDDDLEEARWLRAYIDKTGFLQLGWPFQGSVMLYETGTDWYDRYQRLLELSDDFGSIPIDEPDQDEER
jgi:hypothetical protein